MVGQRTKVWGTECLILAVDHLLKVVSVLFPDGGRATVEFHEAGL